MSRRTKTLRGLCAAETTSKNPLDVIVDVLEAQNICTVDKLSKAIGISRDQIYRIFSGHIFRANNPSYLVTASAARLAKFLFPNEQFPSDKLARVVKGLELLDGKTLDQLPKTSEVQKNSAVARYVPEPGKPYLSYKNGKWTLLIAPKIP